jgi:hypothetical protein
VGKAVSCIGRNETRGVANTIDGSSSGLDRFLKKMLLFDFKRLGEQ